MQSFFEVLIIGIVLSADSFSAAFAMGGRPFKKSDALKFGVCSGAAEALSTFLGFWAGANVISYISAYDHWIAFFLLGGVAMHMAWEAISHMRSNVDEVVLNFHSFSKVLLVSFATSLDAFGVGLGLGVANKNIGPYVLSIGFWAFTMTVVGLYAAKKLSKKFGPTFTFIGACILGYLAFRMLEI